MRTLTIGTRGSLLARWQAEHVASRLRMLQPGLQVELRIIKTKGDKILDVPLAKVGGKGLFVKEIEEALKRREIDLAVHSIKDVPAELIEGARLGAIPERADARDALVGRFPTLAALPRGARVGTSSLRRRTQLLQRRDDLEILDLRGNVDTRLQKLDRGDYDAIVLAAAGLDRLGHAERIAAHLDLLPAAGQGALGIETRADDDELNDLLLRGLHHPPTGSCVEAERALLARLGGGCQVPIAAHAVLQGSTLRLRALVGHPSGQPVFEAEGEGDRSDPAALGTRIAERLLDAGAEAVLQEIYST